LDRVKNTPLGSWLAKAAPDVLKAVGGLIAEKAVWPLVQRMLNKRRLSKLDMQHAVQLAEISFSDVRADLWKHDSVHGSWLSKNARPIMTFGSMLGAGMVTYLEATGHDVSDMWEGVWGTLCFSTVGAYFVVQTIDNGKAGRHRRKLFGRRVDSGSSAGTA
jgi:hypothetical protein